MPCGWLHKYAGGSGSNVADSMKRLCPWSAAAGLAIGVVSAVQLHTCCRGQLEEITEASGLSNKEL